MSSTPPQPPQNQSQAKIDSSSSPLKLDTGRSTFASEVPSLVQDEPETSNEWFGPVSPIKFLAKFLPAPPGLPRRPNFQRQRWRNIRSDAKKKFDMCYRFTKLLDRYCTNLELKVTCGASNDINWTHQTGLIKVDVSVFSKNVQLERTFEVAQLETFFEFKRATAFNDDVSEGSPFEKQAKNSQETRAQLATYAGAMLATQFRTHAFCVEVAGDYARLIRFDREGAVFTHAFRYAEETHLIDFLWRFNHSSSEIRGHDRTVTVPSAAESRFVKQATELLPLKSWERVWKFSVYDEGSKKTVVFYGGANRFSVSVSPFGRSTRGFLVIDIHGNIVYLKDTWRIDMEEMQKEGNIYAQLHEKGVPHIPHVVAHGDAGQQKTLSRSSFPDLFRPGEPSHPFQHYYIVFREVGRRLTEFRTTHELVNAIKDAMKAHQVAYDEAKILHCDISSGNILISEDGKSGFLIDWDFSKPVVDCETPREHGITGTWEFMSAELLLGNATCHKRTDDLESFFHVLCWVLLKYGPHSLTVETVIERLGWIYNYVMIYRGRSKGGTHKERSLRSRDMRRAAGLPDGCLKDLLVDFEDLVAVRYDHRPSPKARQQYDELAALANYDEKKLDRHPIWKYDKFLQRLEGWDWIYERFCEATRDSSQLSDARIDREQELAAAYVKDMVTERTEGTRSMVIGSKKRLADDSDSQPTLSKKRRR
ncbi:other 1 protein kinase [Moniliophthora roreri]|nr:other 1 protein kinase [Moniliophthora roreri]